MIEQTRKSYRSGIGSFLTLVVSIAGMLVIHCSGGCAGSASNGWAQRSPLIAPEQRPPAMTVFSNGVSSEDDELH